MKVRKVKRTQCLFFLPPFAFLEIKQLDFLLFRGTKHRKTVNDAITEQMTSFIIVSYSLGNFRNSGIFVRIFRPSCRWT